MTMVAHRLAASKAALGNDIEPKLRMPSAEMSGELS
jgi:hypothetical protein